MLAWPSLGRRRRVSCIAMIALLLGTGDVITVPSLSTHAHFAETIALVRVSASKAMTIDVDGQTEGCGHVYTASVVQSVKGAKPGATIDFFSDYDSGRTRYGDFFVVLRHSTPQVREAVLAALADDPPGRDRERAKCSLRNERSVRGSAESLMIPASAELAHEPGGPWFVRTRSNVLWRPDFESVPVEKDGEHYDAVSWNEIQRVFQYEMTVR